MFKKLAALAAVILSFAATASAAQAGWVYTGWRCDNYGQLIHYGYGALLGCWYYFGGLFWFLLQV